jgi:hypothetical protein
MSVGSTANQSFRRISRDWGTEYDFRNIPRMGKLVTGRHLQCCVACESEMGWLRLGLAMLHAIGDPRR